MEKRRVVSPEIEGSNPSIHPYKKSSLPTKIRVRAEQGGLMHDHVRYLYLPSLNVRGEVEFFRISRNGDELVVERLELDESIRHRLSTAVTETGFTTLEQLLAPHVESWKEVGRGDKKAVGEAINCFAEGNQK